jgi:hypothetical protein
VIPGTEEISRTASALGSLAPFRDMNCSVAAFVRAIFKDSFTKPAAYQ